MRESRNRQYLLTVLLAILAFNYVDRLALGVVLQDIKRDLKVSDTQLGLLSGIAFAFFYSVMGIPIARLADRGNRVTIISLTTALWSIAVALCGLAVSFGQLLLIRVGVAVGEAGCLPPAHSLIADYFPRAERPRAVARYMLGGPLSVVVGYFIAGWLNQFYGWRLTFILIGLPGFGLAAVAQLTLREPRCDAPETGASSSVPPGAPGFKEAWSALWANATFRHLLLSWSVTSFFAYGILQWQPAFFVRSYGISTGELGTWFAVIYGVGGLLGTYWGGEFASRRAAQNECWQLRGAAAIYVSFGLVSACAYLAPTHYLAFGLLWVAAAGGAMVTGPLFATIQTLVPERTRATSVALMSLFANLIGMGLGPLAVGVLSDALQPLVGAESLRYALLALCPGYIWGASHLWLASKTVTRDLEAAEARAAHGAGGRMTPVRAESSG
jgi:predicted MFS family arabinose efflux permease